MKMLVSLINCERKNARYLNIGYYVDKEVTEDYVDAQVIEGASNLDALTKKDSGDLDAKVMKDD